MSGTKQPIKNINPKPDLPFALIVSHDPITDPRLSLADLGLYVRCLWLREVVGMFGDVDWFIKELGMPEAETREGLRRLADAGYLEVADPGYVKSAIAKGQATGIRAALEESGDQLSEAERAAVSRLVALTEWRARRASQSSWEL